MIFNYTVIRSKRKSVAIQVGADCSITVRAPLKISQKEIENIMQDKKEWLEKAIISQREKAKTTKRYTDEDIKLLRARAKEVIPQKVEYFSDIMGVKPTAVKINSAKKRYGSCSGENSLNFSLYLMDKDERFIDYVVVHELAHIRHHNHSKDFYRFIEGFMPDYKERMKLK
ncbi:MAG: M48 family metallopeptidase [Clostridia bacterium]|nr:M48 family metallopeptidase [Clostridia bacterium]